MTYVLEGREVAMFIRFGAGLRMLKGRSAPYLRIEKSTKGQD